MNKTDSIKCFISSVKDYIKNSNEATTSALQRNLDILTGTPDFTPLPLETALSADFYESLYNLISIMETSNPLFWTSLDLVCTLSSHSSDTLIHIYKFPQLLSQFLTTSLIPDQRMKLLRLLKHLTKGIRVHWYERWLPDLIHTLTQWIDPAQAADLITNSLSLLINLCRNNPPSIYALVETTNNTKKFNKNLLRLPTNDPKIQILCCKILLTMEETNHEIPEQFILKFVEVTFQIITNTIDENQKKLLKETVDFFEEVRLHEKTKNYLKNFTNYSLNLETILALLENSSPEITEIALKFFASVSKLRITQVFELYKKFAKIAMASLRNIRVSKNAIFLLKVIVQESPDRENPFLSEDEVDFITSLMLRDDVDDGLMVQLLQLLQELILEFRNQVSQRFPEPKAREILQKSVERVGTSKQIVKNQSGTAVFVNLLALISALSTGDEKWYSWWRELAQNKKIHMLLAAAIFSSDIETKSKALRLVSALGPDSEGIVKCLVDLEDVFLIEKPLQEPNLQECINHFERSRNPPPSGERLTRILDKIEEKMDNNDLKNVHVTEIMELFQHKMDEMQKTEDYLKKSLVFQEHRAVQMTLKFGRMQELLFTAEKKCESVQGQNAKLLMINDQLRNEIRGLKKIIMEKSKATDDLSEKVDKMMQKIRDLEAEVVNLRQEKQDLKEENEGFMRNIHMLQDSVKKREDRLTEKAKENETVKEALAAARQKNEQFIRQCKEYEVKILEKEENIKKLETELIDLSKLRDTIYALTAQKKDHQNETT